MVVAAEGPADRYLVSDGYKRIAALEQLGRDTVEAPYQESVRRQGTRYDGQPGALVSMDVLEF